MRAARVLMNLGRASALAAGPRRRGADREAWNRSRRTLLRAREAAERTGGELGDEALKLEAQMAARERTERDRGIPAGYEPGETPPAERPASYFVRDPEARAQLEAKERAEGGYDPDRQARAHRAYRQQMATVSRGYGAPAPQAAPAPGTESPWEPERMRRIAGETARAGLLATDPGYRLGEPVPIRTGAVMPTGEESDPYLRGRYVGAPLTEAQQQAAAETQKRLQEGQDVAVAVQRQRALRAQLQAAGAPILPGPQTLGEIQAQQAIVAAQQAEAAQAQAAAEAGAGIAPRAAEAGVAGMEAEVEQMRTQTATVQEMIRQAQTGNQQARQAILEGIQAAGEAGDAEAAMALQGLYMGTLGLEYVDPPTWARLWNFLRRLPIMGGFYFGGLAPEAPAGGWQPTAPGVGAGAAPAAPVGLPATGPNAPGAPPTGQFGFRGGIGQPVVQAGGGAAAGAQAGAVIPGNVDTATATPEELIAIRDAAEAELQRRRQMGTL